MAANYRSTRNACYMAIFIHATVNNLAPLLFIVFQADYGLSYQRLGTLVMVNFMVQLAMDAICIKFADKLGYRFLLVLAHIFCGAGLLLLGTLPRLLPDTYLALVLSIVVYAIGGGLLEVLVSPVVDSLPVPDEEKAASMSLLHSFYCWGQVAVVLLSTLLLRLIGRSLWYALPFLWAILPALNMLRFLRVPVVQPVSAEKAMRLRELLRIPAFWAFMLLMLSAGASEQSMSQWASLFAERGLGLSKVVGDLLGPCLFAVTMALGRMIYGVWGARMNLFRYMGLCTVLCIGCYLGATLFTSPSLNLLCCALTGFSVSIMWPGSVSAASARFPLGGTTLFAVMALMGDLGCSVGPWFTGLIAERADSGLGLSGWLNNALYQGGAGLSVGILASVIFPVATLATMLFASRRKEPTA